MNRTVYTCIFYLALPFILLSLFWRGRKVPAYRQRWQERLGKVEIDSKLQGALWIHAVSVGETLAITPLVKLLQAEYPDLPIVMTTMTPTGAERVVANFGQTVTHIYCPYDLPFALSRFINKVQPRACVIVETELWPNMLQSCKAHKIPVLVANARLSQRSADGYARFGKLSRAMLQNITCIAAQNKVDGQRFVDLGLPESSLSITGSIKFDVSAPEGSERLAAALRELWGARRRVLIAASTHDQEEATLIATYQQLLPRYPDLLLILVPRHPERFDGVAQLLQESGLNYCRRSQGGQPSADTQVYLGDTMGELMKLLAASDIAFVGGSLIERGGHNPLEPAVLAKPVVMGPHFFNFQLICDSLEQAGGLQIAADETALLSTFDALIDDPEAAARIGEAGQQFVLQNQGALQRLYTLVEEVCLQKQS